MIAIETAKVYRGGGRRYFTLKAAVKAEARKKINSRKLTCECDYCDHDELPGCPREDLPCRLHGERFEVAYRRLTRIYMAAAKSAPPTKEGNEL